VNCAFKLQNVGKVGVRRRLWCGLQVDNQPTGTLDRAILHLFNDNDGHGGGDVILGPEGTLFSITNGTFGYGVIVELTPGSGGEWKELVVHRFGNGSDGILPTGIAVNPLGSLYGITSGGGDFGNGTVFRLTSTNGNHWKERVLYNFQSQDRVRYPNAPILDPEDNIFDTTQGGGLLRERFRISCHTVTCGTTLVELINYGIKKLRTTVWIVMMKAMCALTRYAAGGIEETGLGLSDFGVLELLLRNGPLPVNTISLSIASSRRAWSAGSRAPKTDAFGSLPSPHAARVSLFPPFESIPGR
jgi:hypothetical protein